MFGNVFLVVNCNTKRLYALKTISKKKIEKYAIQDCILLERRILLTIDHVFILKLVKSFKDTKRVYLLTEYVRGFDMYTTIRELDIVSDADAKFYTACIILILEYIHDRDIVYRDLKPENIMIDEEGYPKLIDFGVSTFINGRTYTIVGTPHYMAPEVIIGKGYSISVDYWSLGIMLYEFLCAGVPFGEEENDPYKVYEKVLERRLVYPCFVSSNAPGKPMIEQLLSRNPVLRNGGSIGNLKGHRWFGDIHWDALVGKMIKSPYTPTLPNLDKDISKALRDNINIEEQIAKEEVAEGINEKSPKRPNVPVDWDREF